MDADYDRTKTLQSELIDASRKKKKRRRSKFAEVIAAEKPKFDPTTHSSFREYIEQYYALDYEDMIDDMPCRFKYRNVMPNDYGLSVEEVRQFLFFSYSSSLFSYILFFKRKRCSFLCENIFSIIKKRLKVGLKSL